jgi:hypothetical protein
MMKAKITVTKDFTENFKAIIKRFKYDHVLVGIPEENAQRQADGSDEQINNATLFAIANFGSPKRNIPPWPIMAIGIRNAKEDISDQYKKAAQSALANGIQALDTYYDRAGLIASNSIKKVINAQEDVPEDKPSPATLAARKNRKPTPFKGTKYWLVTGQMRNAITYVIGGRK